MSRRNGPGRDGGREGGRTGRRAGPGKPSGYGKPRGYADRGGNGEQPAPRRKGAPGQAPGKGAGQGYGKGQAQGPGKGPGKAPGRGPAKGPGPFRGQEGSEWRAPGAAWDRQPRGEGSAKRGPGHRGGKPGGPHGRAPSIKPSKPALGQLLGHYGVRLQPHTLDQLWAYHQLLRANNHDQDLTRLIGFDTMAQRHYADCMILHGLMQGRWPSPLVDVGTGAGFPGMMIKLMSPSTRIVLAEPRPRRVQFLEMVIRELGLKDISVFGHKVTSRSLTQPFAGAITRAFETVEKTLPRFGSCLGVGGKAIFMKGPKAAEEVAAFQSDEYKIIRNHAYTIPNTHQDRVLLILERIKVPEPGAAAYDESQESDMEGDAPREDGPSPAEPGDG